MRALAAEKPTRRAIIDRLTLIEYDGARAVIGCAPAFVQTSQSYAGVIAEVFAAATGRTPAVQVRAVEGLAPASTPTAAPEAGTASAATRAPSAAERAGLGSPLRDHPLVRTAAELFSARIVEVSEQPGP